MSTVRASRRHLAATLTRGSHSSLITGLALALLLCLAPAARGQESERQNAEAAADEPVVEEITVWGERLEESLPQEVAEYGSRLETVGSEEIERGGFVDVSQILGSRVPGLYVSQQNGPFDYVNVSLQGSNRKEVLWLVDGVRFSNRLYDTTTPLDTFPASIVERVEVLKGGQGLFYGTQAVGGVINLITRSDSRQPGGRLSLGLDGDEGTHANAFVQAGKGGHRFVFYGSNDEADGFQPFRDGDYQPSATDRERGYDVTSLGARYRVAPSQTFLVSAQLQHTDAELDFAVAEDRAESFNERDEDIGWAKLDWRPGRNFDLYVKAYWHDWDSHFTRIDNDLANPGALITISDRAVWEFTDSGVNVLGEVGLNDRTRLLVGFDSQSYDGRDEEFLIGQQSETVNALFSQVRFDVSWLDGASIAVGGRYNDPSDGESKTVFDLSGELSINPTLYARARVGTAFRLPSAYELYVIDPCCEQGNPNLVGEESFNVEIGLGGRHDRFYWEAMAFQRDVDDLIRIDFDLPGFPDGLIVNSDEEVEVEGFEALAGLDLTRGIAATLDYTHADSTEKGSADQLDDIPVDQAKLVIDWRPDASRLATSASASWVGDVFDSVASGIGRVEHGNYVVVDLSASYAFDPEGRHRFGLRLANAFDEEYDTRVVRVRRDVDGSPYAAGMLGHPRTWYGTYSFNF